MLLSLSVMRGEEKVVVKQDSRVRRIKMWKSEKSTSPGLWSNNPAPCVTFSPLQVSSVNQVTLYDLFHCT